MMKPTKVLVISALVLMMLTLTALWRSWTAAADPPAKARQESPAAVIDASKYPNLQAALDAVPQAGGLVKLPPGDFELTCPLVLAREDTRLEGAGTATRLINRNRQGQPALVLRSPNRAANPKARAWRMQVADFRISGNPASGDGLLAENIDEIYIHGMSIDHNGGHGINLVDCLEDPRVCDSIMTYNGLAGLNIIRAHDIVVSANQFEENQDAVRSIDCRNLCMSGNNIDDHLRHGVVIEETYGSVLSGNMIEECRAAALLMDKNCYGITISANVFAHNYGKGIDMRDAWGCTVSANTFCVVEQGALIVGPDSGRITITGNNFTNGYSGERRRFKNTPATGILLEGTSDIAISGNVFSGLLGQAVKAEGPCRRITMVGNVIVDQEQEPSRTAPAVDLAGAKQSAVGQNVIEKGLESKLPK